MKFVPYNKKAFLLPDSINSAAMFHAKIFEDGRYIFRIHDCITGISLTGDLEKEQDFIDASKKAEVLSLALAEFSFHINKLRDEIYRKQDESTLPDCLHNQYCEQVTKKGTFKSKSGCNFQYQTNN